MDRNEKIKKIFALLFVEAKIEKKKLKELGLEPSKEDLDFLKSKLFELGSVLIESANAIELALSAESSDWIKKIYTKDEAEDLSDSASQILTLVLHCGPISKFEIDYIRGVNSASSLRKLQLKGYIEKRRLSGKNIYQASHQLLSDFGIDDLEKFQKESEFCKKIKKLLSLNEDGEDEQ